MSPTLSRILLLCACFTALGVTTPCRAQSSLSADVWTDTKLYFTSPLRWDTQDWLFFGGAVAAIGAAHQYDGDVRRHFAGQSPVLDGKDTHSLRDAAPAALVVLGTWAYAGFTDDYQGHRETFTMLEAAAFSTVTAEGLKFAAGRARPNESNRVDDWRAGGSSFPSLHATAAFAIGTVLAESGSDEYRWVRRVLGYGIAGATAYIRVKDNVHWLSDTVAGAALGAATARFAMNRREARHPPLDVSIGPAQGGGMSVSLNYTFQ
ncbi:MAG TPA: phosphatase PAP2 family protein [Steroidobacteraceae bacterium]|nr:phosphatase PAP2 family protein [Steroidobacteraceae bacterium]